jgi:hypothetical protein
MRNAHLQNDPVRNRNFNRRWRFHPRDRRFDALPALDAQRERDADARRRLCMPVPRQSAAIFAEIDA